MARSDGPTEPGDGSMFFADVYESWKELQEYKYEQIFRVLGKNFLTNFDKVLDLGCGTGYLEEFLKHKGIRANIIGLDSNYAKLDFPFVVGDGNQMPFADNAFDAAVCVDVMQLLERHDFARVLKRKGFILAAVFFSQGNYEERKWMLRRKLQRFDVLLEFEIDGKEKEYVVLARKK